MNDSIRYFLYTGYTSIRKGMFTLSRLVQERMGNDIRSGGVFIFHNRFLTKIKLLHAEPAAWFFMRNCLRKDLQDSLL